MNYHAISKIHALHNDLDLIKLSQVQIGAGRELQIYFCEHMVYHCNILVKIWVLLQNCHSIFGLFDYFMNFYRMMGGYKSS